MKHIKIHPIHENDSNLSQATIINKHAQPTMIGQEREDDNAYQRLSQATKRNDNPSKTITTNSRPEQGDDFQKVSHVAEIDVEPSSSKPVTIAKYQHLSNGTKIENDTESTYKMNPRPEQGDTFQKTSHVAEIDVDATQTIKKNERPGQGDNDQHLSDIAEGKVIRFNDFKK